MLVTAEIKFKNQEISSDDDRDRKSFVSELFAEKISLEKIMVTTLTCDMSSDQRAIKLISCLDTIHRMRLYVRVGPNLF